MNWEVFTRLSPPEIQFHWVTAAAAFVIGLVIFGLRKGTRLHKVLGWTYVVLMVSTATAAIFIRSIGGLPTLFGFTPIHLFIPLTFFGLAGAIVAIKRKNVAGHRMHMRNVFLGALVITGAFTFLPGRRMNLLLFGDKAEIADVVARKAAQDQGR